MKFNLPLLLVLCGFVGMAFSLKGTGFAVIVATLSMVLFIADHFNLIYKE
jgi:hypothetical protein